MKLGEACFLKSGKNITAKEIYVSPKDNLYPCYGGNGLRGYVDKYNYEGDYNLIGRQGALCGNINRVNGKFYATEHAVVVTPLISLDIDWLYFALVGMDLNQYHTGAAQPGLNIDILNNLEIDVPIIGEQIAQATVLNKINGMIRNRKRELEKLDDLIKARFVELFGEPIANTKGLETKALKDVLVLKAGDFTAASDIVDEPNEINKYPCFGGNGIRGYVAEYNQEGEYSLIGRQGALSGNVQFAKGKFKNTEHALLVTPLIKMNNTWLNQLLLNLDLKRYQTGAAQPGLSVKNLQEIPIIVVPLQEQNYFADFVDQIDKSKAEVQKSLDEAQLLFDSLMQQYFG